MSQMHSAHDRNLPMPASRFMQTATPAMSAANTPVDSKPLRLFPFLHDTGRAFMDGFGMPTAPPSADIRDAPFNQFPQRILDRSSLVGSNSALNDLASTASIMERSPVVVALDTAPRRPSLDFDLSFGIPPGHSTNPVWMSQSTGVYQSRGVSSYWTQFDPIVNSAYPSLTTAANVHPAHAPLYPTALTTNSTITESLLTEKRPILLEDSPFEASASKPTFMLLSNTTLSPDSRRKVDTSNDTLVDHNLTPLDRQPNDKNATLATNISFLLN
jgi:hypothetical protein